MVLQPNLHQTKRPFRHVGPGTLLMMALFMAQAVRAGNSVDVSVRTFRILIDATPVSSGSTFISRVAGLENGTLAGLSDEESRAVLSEGRMEPVDRGENLRIVSESNPLPNTYAPKDLVTIGSVRGNIQVARRVEISGSILVPLDALFHYVNTQSGGRLILVSGFRPYGYQQYLFNRKLNQIYKTHPELSPANEADKARAEVMANLIAARPGTSEHQFLAADITTLHMLRTCADPLTDPFAESPEGRLVLQNAHKFGFDISFKNTPESVQDSGHSYEPWHICYRGLPHSEILHRNQWSLPQYLRYLSGCRSVVYKSDAGDLYVITTVGTEI